MTGNRRSVDMLRYGLIALGLAACCAAAPADYARADEALEVAGEVFEAPPDLADDDELWIVSTRAAGCLPDRSILLHYWRYDGAGNWRSSSLEEFAAADPALPTCFHIHGNRVSWSHSNYGGWRYYTALTGGCCPRPPLRFVIFSWPSDRWCNASQRDDVRGKAVLSERHAYYLAYLVDRLPATHRISMIGYSYGARLIGGALHLLGGGSLRGNVLTRTGEIEPRQIRAVMLSGALDDDHLCPGHCFQMAPSQLDHLLVSVNCADHVLKWYCMLYELRLRRRTGQQAMGFVGACRIPQLGGRVEHRNVVNLVGDSHEWHGFEYLCGNFLERMRQYAYYEPLDCRGATNYVLRTNLPTATAAR